MKIGWSEVIIIFIILSFTSGILRPAVRIAYKAFKEGYTGSGENSESAHKTSTSGSSPDHKNHDIPKKNARSSVEQEEQDPYATLNIQAAASRAEIIAAYRKLAQLYHPDKVAGLAPEYQEIAERKMKMINNAYKILRDKLPDQ
jgi:hypothetical protein